MKISPREIADALQAQIHEVFPDETIYVDLAPQNFDRPSNLLELVKMELDPVSFGMSAITIRYHYKITTFAAVDPVHDSHLPELDLRAMKLLSSFGIGYLRVSNRALKIQSCIADTNSYDAAEVTVVLSLTVDRTELAEFVEETAPLMQKADVQYQEKKKERLK